MTAHPDMFLPCADCESVDDCTYNGECWFEAEYVGWTQEEENRLNDPRHEEPHK